MCCSAVPVSFRQEIWQYQLFFVVGSATQVNGGQHRQQENREAVDTSWVSYSIVGAFCSINTFSIVSPDFPIFLQMSSLPLAQRSCFYRSTSVSCTFF